MPTVHTKQYIELLQEYAVNIEISCVKNVLRYFSHCTLLYFDINHELFPLVKH